MTRLEPAALTPGRLRKGAFAKELPELFALRAVVEHNAWHAHDSVFNHSLTAAEALPRILRSAPPAVSAHLRRSMGRHTRRELLALTILLHDIGKPETFTRKGAVTACPKHDLVGAKKAAKLLGRLRLSAAERRAVAFLIRNHIALSQLSAPGNPRAAAQLAAFEQKAGSWFPELALLAAADLLGSQLRRLDPAAAAFRLRFYRACLRAWAQQRGRPML